MAEISKFMQVSIENLAKLFGVSKSSLNDVVGLTVPAGGAGGDRGVFGGGWDGDSYDSNTIDYITISSIGNAQDFGDLVLGRGYPGSTSNGGNNRGVFGSGFNGSNNNIMDYITISTAGNAQDFGDLTAIKHGVGGTSNNTNNRGVFAGGFNGSVYINTIEYVTISSIGDAADFGDLTIAKGYLAATSNGINNRGVFGASVKNSGLTNIIDYITINSIGNATDFGDATTSLNAKASTSNLTNNRGVFAGGFNLAGSSFDIIEYITISTPGNAADFGDLTQSRSWFGAVSNGTNERGVFGGGSFDGVSFFNILDYITINSTSDAIDFGDLTLTRDGVLSTSNA